MTDSHAQRVQAYLDARAELNEHGAELGDQIAEAKNGGKPWARLTVTDVQGVLDELDAAQSSADQAATREIDLRQRVAELEAELAALKDTRPCGRSATHPPHKWMSDRRGIQCAGVGDYDIAREKP